MHIWNFLELLEFTDEYWNLRSLELYWNWNLQHRSLLRLKPRPHNNYIFDSFVDLLSQLLHRSQWYLFYPFKRILHSYTHALRFTYIHIMYTHSHACIHIHGHTYTNTYIHPHRYTYAYIHTCMHSCIHSTWIQSTWIHSTWIHAHKHKHSHTYMHTGIHIHIHSTRIRMHGCARTDKNIHMDTYVYVTHKPAHRCTCIRARTHTYTCMHTDANTHIYMHMHVYTSWIHT